MLKEINSKKEAMKKLRFINNNGRMEEHLWKWGRRNKEHNETIRLNMIKIHDNYRECVLIVTLSKVFFKWLTKKTV